MRGRCRARCRMQTFLPSDELGGLSSLLRPLFLEALATPLLRGIVFVSEATLGLCVECIGCVWA